MESNGIVYVKVYEVIDMRIQNYFVVILSGALMLLSTASSAWVVEQDFEGVAVGVRCLPFFITGQDSTISTEMSSSGTGSCKMSIRKGGTGWGGGFVPTNVLRQGDEVWLRFRLFIPNGFDFNAYGAGDRLKFIRMTARNPGGTVGRLDWYWDREGTPRPHRMILERDDVWQVFGQNEGPVRGRWETWEMYAKFDYVAVDNGGLARVRTFKDGRLIGDMTARPTMWSDNVIGNSTEIVSFLIFSFWNGTAPQTQSLYFDDLVATDAAPGSMCDGVPCIGVGSFLQIFPPAPPTILDN